MQATRRVAFVKKFVQATGLLVFVTKLIDKIVRVAVSHSMCDLIEIIKIKY